MSVFNTANVKQAFRLIEIPLNKFQEEALPHHRTVYEAHKSSVQKLINLHNLQQLAREIKDKKRIVCQLKDLMYELDTLRTQVEDSDLGKFDLKTLSVRKTILELIGGYAVLETESTKAIENYIQENNDSKEKENPVNGILQVQIEANLEELELQGKEQSLLQVETLNKDIEDVHEIFTDLNQMVEHQKEHVDVIAANTEVTNENINSGLQQLVQASKLHKASYPVAGAFIGTIIGGPIGSVAGLKIGCLAAVSCGLMGYIGGKFMKKKDNLSNKDNGLSTAIDNSKCNTLSTSNKKDI